MRILLVTTSVIAILTGSAQAADMPVKALPVAAGYSWTGFYFGVNAGYSVGRNPSEVINFTNPPPGTLNLFRPYNESPAGWLGGVQAGYNWQHNNLVYGVEADFQATGQKDSHCFICIPATGEFDITQKQPWLGTVRGRLGWAAGPVLSYVTGGWAYGRVETDTTLVITGFPTTGATSRENKSGWTVGGGVEAALAGPWTAKVEYLYVSLGSITVPTFNSGTGGSRTTVTSDIRDHIIRAGLNYRLGPTSGTGTATSPAVRFANWSGFYVGGDVGKGVGRNPTTLNVSVAGTPLTTDEWKQSPSGWLGGVHAGYNWQSANLVYGVEADIQGGRLKDSACMVICGATSLTDVVDQKISWLGTIRARAGYAAGPALFFVTGGWAIGQVQTTITESLVVPATPTVVASASSTKSGWTVGGGAEVAVMANWSAKTEYLYVDLGSTGLSFANIVPGPITFDHVLNSKIRTHIFRSGLSYHF